MQQQLEVVPPPDVVQGGLIPYDDVEAVAWESMQVMEANRQCSAFAQTHAAPVNDTLEGAFLAGQG